MRSINTMIAQSTTSTIEESKMGSDDIFLVLNTNVDQWKATRDNRIEHNDIDEFDECTRQPCENIFGKRWKTITYKRMIIFDFFSQDNIVFT